MLQGNRGAGEKGKLSRLSKKYNTTGFMYTEYPHKRFWPEGGKDTLFKKVLAETLKREPNRALMLYVHIPYCEQLCWFCTCHMSITQDYEKVKRSLDLLYKEIDWLHDFFKEHGIQPNFQEIHLGGGSPTFVREPEFDVLIKKLSTLTDVKALAEFAIEIDPRRVDTKRMAYYHEQGISRISFGVQDFDLDVQKAVNRVQPAELLEGLLVPDIRKLFARGVNFDIICGLPNQTPDSIRRTCERVAQIGPDRICLNYLHYAPQFAKHQTTMMDGKEGRPKALPDFYERKAIFTEALGALTQLGYVRTGYDHFAKPTDDVAKAMQKGEMRWNALGVTPGRVTDVIGIGVSSLSTIDNAYFQNFYELVDYEEALNKKEFPINRGYQLNTDDVIRRDVIQTIRSFFSIDFKSIEDKYKIVFSEYFKNELATIGPFVEDGIVTVGKDSLRVTELGHQFTNLICRHFDQYYQEDKLARDAGERFKATDSIREKFGMLKKLLGKK